MDFSYFLSRFSSVHPPSLCRRATLFFSLSSSSRSTLVNVSFNVFTVSFLVLVLSLFFFLWMFFLRSSFVPLAFRSVPLPPSLLFSLLPHCFLTAPQCLSRSSSFISFVTCLLLRFFCLLPIFCSRFVRSLCVFDSCGFRVMEVGNAERCS